MNNDWTLLGGTPDAVDWSASTVDTANNLIEAGNTLTTGQGANILTTKKSAAGQLYWEKEFDGTASGNDYGIAVTTDNNSNVLVAGTSFVPDSNDYDFIVLKYTSAGTLSWQYSYDGQNGQNDLPVGILVDGSGNTYVTA